MKDIHATLTLKNNQLRARREALGMNQSQLAAAVGIEPGRYGALENLRRLPIVTTASNQAHLGDWTSDARKLAAFYNVLPEDLFPEAVLQLPQARFERELDAWEMQELLAPPLDPLALAAREEEEAMEGRIPRALAELTPREARIVRARFGLDGQAPRTQEQIGEAEDISQARVQQIEAKALRKLRSPTMKDLLRGEESPEAAVATVLPKLPARAHMTAEDVAFAHARAKMLPEAQALADRERISVVEALQRLWEARRKRPSAG